MLGRIDPSPPDIESKKSPALIGLIVVVPIIYAFAAFLLDSVPMQYCFVQCNFDLSFDVSLKLFLKSKKNQNRNNGVEKT